MLELATPDTAPLLSNLLALYMQDMSEIFPVAVGADGRFEYGNLPLYWSEPHRRFAFLIRSGPRAGRVRTCHQGLAGERRSHGA